MLLLDSGAFLAAERNDRDLVALIRAHRQSRSLSFAGVDVVPLDAELGRGARMLPKAARRGWSHSTVANLSNYNFPIWLMHMRLALDSFQNESTDWCNGSHC